MNLSTYIPVIVIFIILFWLLRNQKLVIAREIIKKRKMEDNKEMIELAKKFIGKECLVDAFDSGRSFEGVIKEVSDGAILIEKNGAIEVVNLDFIIRIREYPKNKKGKKKVVFE